ncbi:hypothetical protein GGI07_003277 [Coemansia sp. Benny D115]|nr:hypothetical protein GGI07_003277 [Coemansia sp. Benny D115]
MSTQPANFSTLTTGSLGAEQPCSGMDFADDNSTESSEEKERLNEELTKAVAEMLKPKSEKETKRMHKRAQKSAHICGRCREVVEDEIFYYHSSRCGGCF